LNQTVINGLGMLGTEGTVIVILESMPVSSFQCPAMIMYDKPNKHATLVKSPDIP
jgi:hypothetical protein